MSKDSKAIKQTGKILSFIPTGEYYFSKGVKEYQRRDYYKAKRYFERAFHLEPLEPMIACQLAIVLTELGDFKESNVLLHQIIDELDPYMIECHYFLANNYAYLGMFKEAYEHAKQYLDKEEEGEFSEDAEDLLDLIAVESDDLSDILYAQDDLITKQEEARELLESGHFPKAVEQLKEIIAEYPEFWSAYNNLALAYFYLGETDKAEQILNEVLEKNAGNLHALCNKLIFYYYQHREEELNELADALEKVNPILTEHRFKLGAAFALIGRYEKSFQWLRKLQKQGFEGDGSFFYWLSYAAYNIGHVSTAQAAWKKVLELTPEKEGLEPWNDEKPHADGLEQHASSIIRKFESDYIEERLFAFFLTSVSQHKDEIIKHTAFRKASERSSLERQYSKLLKGEHGKVVSPMQQGHEVAQILYKHYVPIGTAESGLFLMWFTVFADILVDQNKISNEKAFAAAMDYIWHRLRREPLAQKQIAGLYNISLSTLQKYVKMVNEHLR